MRVRLTFGVMILVACGGSGDDGPTGGDADISGAWALLGQANSTSGVPGTCTISGALFLNQSGDVASGTFDGSTSCEVPEIGEENESVEGPVEGIQVDGDNVSWSGDGCDLTGEFESEDRIAGDLACTTTYLDIPVAIEGTWQMSR
jgi:hypothetical protein